MTSFTALVTPFTKSGAVDETFVQFYPTLMPIAKDKGTLIADYLKEIEAK